MPYITKPQRTPYDKNILVLAEKVRKFAEDEAASPAGQLNYIITRLILEVYGEWLPNYSDFNEIVGILECAKMEMYRKHTAPYEDEKIKENGDVEVSIKRS